MCWATQPSKGKIRGCLSLLQSWAQFRFPFLLHRFQWTLYEDPTIQVVIPDEFLQNLNTGMLGSR
ncbi:hypothetical protein Gotur_013766 [Gossypium turneri]